MLELRDGFIDAPFSLIIDAVKVGFQGRGCVECCCNDGDRGAYRLSLKLEADLTKPTVRACILSLPLYSLVRLSRR